MAENVLEILLGGDFAEKFKKMDDNLTKIEQHTSETSERMKELVQSLDKLGGTLNGSVNTGLVNLAANFDKLNAAISKMGASSKSSIEGTANSTNRMITQLSGYYSKLLQYENSLNRVQTMNDVKQVKGESVSPKMIEAVKTYIKLIDDMKVKIAALSKGGGADAVNLGKLYDAKSAANFEMSMQRYIAAIAKAEEQVRKLRDEEQKRNSNSETNSSKELSQLSKLYSTKLNYENQIAAMQRKMAVNQEKGILPSSNSTEYQAVAKYRELLGEIDKKIAAITSRNKEAAKTASLVYDAKHLQQEVKNQEQKEAAINRVTKALEKEAEAQVKLDEKNRNNSFGVADSNGIVTEPRTIEQYRLAIANLKREMQKMPVDDKQGIEGMRKKMDEYKKKLQEVEGEQKKVANSAKGMGISLRNVASAFGIYFSVQSLKNFGKNIAEITGEFELQHRALQAIIGDTQEANRLWDKTIDLAVKSPYRVKDLVTYTKQLAAYRIETNKLYETNKMLADISSGLGVDMGRLILAFGQVKAANYLRGQELRQFSEAGVNILGELSKYFSELEGRAISTGEVFDRVSKRMVSFEDVEVVLKRLTEEGGVFYRMQEIQAETLQGKIMNLKDSFDIMLNEIGTSNRGVIIGVIDSIKLLSDNWKSVEQVMKVVIGLFAAYKVVQISAAASMIKAGTSASVEELALGRLEKTIVRLITQKNRLSVATSRLSETMEMASKKSKWIAILTLAITLISSITQAQKQRNHLEEELSNISGESAREASKMTSNYKEMADKIRDTSTSEEERVKTMEKMRRMYGDILPQRLLNIEYIQKEGNSYKDAISGIRAYYEELRHEREIEKTEEEYGGRVDKSKAKAASAIQSTISRNHGIDVDITSINNALDETLRMYQEREIAFSQLNETLREQIILETGVTLTNEDFRRSTDAMTSPTNEFAMELSGLIANFEEYNKVMESVSGLSKGFTTTLKEALNSDAFGKGNSLLEKAIQRAIDNGEIDGSIESKMKFAGENAAKYYRMGLNVFLNTDFYKGLGSAQKKAALNMFENMFDTKVAEAQITNAQTTISRKFDEIISQFNLNKDQQSIISKLVIGSDESNNEYFDRAKRSIEAYLSEINEINNGISEKIGTKEADTLIGMEPALKATLEFIKMLAGDKKSGGSGSGNPALERLNKQISAIKEANQQYEKYLELFDKEEAFRKVKNEFSGLFKELSMENWVESIRDFSDSEVKNAFDGKLKSSVDAAGKKGREAAEKFATEWQYQIDKTDFDTAMKSFTEGMDEAFSQYDLYKELEKLGIGGDISEYVFGISTLSVNQLKKRLEEAKQQLGMFGNGTGAEEEIKKMEKKISEIEDKERVERLKKYTEYLIKGRDEALKIKIDELRQLAELQDLQSGENPSYTSDQEAEIREKIRKETQKLLDKNVYDSFKNSSFYTMIFDDMAHVTDRSLDVMYEKLSELREKLQELDPSQVKEIVSAMNKIEGERRSRHPFKNITEDLEILSKWNEKENDERLIELQKEYSDLANEKADAIKRAAEAQIEYDKVSSDEIEDNELVAKTDLDNANKALNEILDKMRKIGIEIDGINQSNTEGRTALDGIFKAAEKGIVVFDAIGNVVKSVSDAIVEIYGFTDESTKRLIDDIANITANQGALASNIVKAIQSKGTDVQAMAEGIINTIETIRYIVDWAGIKWVEEIEEQERSLRRLENAAEDLRDAFEGAFTTKQLTEYNRQLKENLTLQIDSYNAMIDAEQQKKNADKDQIQEWRDAISDLRKDIVDQENDFYEALGGVVDFRSASEEFVDAWYEAFKETGDGMDGLEEHFNEMLLNMVKKQAVMKVTDRFLKGIYDMIDLNLEDGELTPSEMTAIMAKAQEVFPELNEWLKTFFDSFGDFGETAENNLTGLQKGIQGVTEETAEIIAAYMNAIRFYSIDSNTQLRSIAAAITDNSGQLNPMLVELRNIAHRTDDIYSFLYQRRENGTDSIRVSIVS